MDGTITRDELEEIYEMYEVRKSFKLNQIMKWENLNIYCSCSEILDNVLIRLYAIVVPTKLDVIEMVNSSCLGDKGVE